MQGSFLLLLQQEGLKNTNPGVRPLLYVLYNTDHMVYNYMHISTSDTGMCMYKYIYRQLLLL